MKWILLAICTMMLVVQVSAVSVVLPPGMHITSGGINSAFVSMSGSSNTYWFYKTNTVVNGWYTYNIRVYAPKPSQTDFVLTETTLSSPTTVANVKYMMPYVCQVMNWPRCDLYPKQVWK